MPKTYRLSLGTRLVNALFRLITRLGLGASYRHILTVPGRKTGRLYSTPVDLIEVDGHRWLVAGYGPANWVRNARAAGEVTLSRGRHTDKFKVEEAEVEAAVPVLRKYIAEIRVTRPYFNANPDSSDGAIAAELERHTVFSHDPSELTLRPLWSLQIKIGLGRDSRGSTRLRPRRSHGAHQARTRNGSLGHQPPGSRPNDVARNYS